MTHAKRGPAFTPEEDMQIVRLRAAGFSFEDVTKALFRRTQRSVETRMQRLEASGEASKIRIALLDSGAIAHDA